MSAKWGFDQKDVASALRHVLIPLVAGAAVAGLQALQAGQLDLRTGLAAAGTALISGILRLLQRWSIDLQGSPREP